MEKLFLQLQKTPKSEPRKKLKKEEAGSSQLDCETFDVPAWL